MSDRTTVLQRIINLRQKSEDGGSTESEMNTAFAMTMKLMNSYSVEEAELALAEATGEIKLDIITKEADTDFKNGKIQHKVLNCVGAIKYFYMHS